MNTQNGIGIPQNVESARRIVPVSVVSVVVIAAVVSVVVSGVVSAVVVVMI